MITADQVLEFFRNEDWENTIHELSDCDKLEIMTTISQSINDDMEILISHAIKTWENQQENWEENQA